MSLLDIVAPTTAPPAVSIPQFSVTLGTGGSAGGGVLDSVGLGEAEQDPWSRSVVRIVSAQYWCPSLPQTKITVVADEQTPDVVLGDDIGLELGFVNDTYQVFTGVISGIENNINGSKTLGLCNGASVLAKMRINQAYEQASAGVIVRDLCSQAGVTTGIIDDGVEFPYYIIDDRRTAYQHIAELARLCGFIAYCDVDNTLCFCALDDSEPLYRATYGLDIIRLQVDRYVPSSTKVLVTGESAAGAEGAEAAFWLIKDPSAVQSEQGDGISQAWQSHPVLNDADAVSSAVAAHLQRASLNSIRGRVTLPGNAAIQCGCFIELADLPDSELNGICLVSGIRHIYDKRNGFISECSFYKSANGYSLSLPSLGDLL